ncbi:MAG: hypothetical protein J3K34DRAFT_448235 [Monoraphidium minutum]|nr:MAG: hypothetical protein J3K34DRAFT_448235 [Monoraphidium minutum]
MANQLGGWRILVNLFMPIPLVLAFLLAVPFPRNVRKGILLFTHRTLSFTMIGGMKLVHFSLIVSGLPLMDSIFRTIDSSKRAHEDDVRPEVKIGLLAKKWREERNFWIAAMGFTLWCLLSVLYSQVSRMVKLEDENEELRDAVADLKGEPRPSAAHSAAHTKVAGAVSNFKQQFMDRMPGRAGRAAGSDADAAASPGRRRSGRLAAKSD